MPIILNGTTGITTPGITNTGPFVFQGVVELPAGAVGAPSLTTTGDTNTGIYFPAANQVAIATDGAQRVLVDATGNVGIGTTTPGNFSSVNFGDSILDVNGAIQVRGDATNGIAIFQLGGDTFRKAIIYSSVGTDTPYLAFGVATSGSSSTASEYARITSGGNVGIGTSSPLGTLGIAGSATATIVIPRSSNGSTASPVETQLIGSTFTNGNFAAGVYALNSFVTNSANWLAFKTTDGGNTTATRMILNQDGNLGLGVTPSAWGTASSSKAMQIGTSLSFLSFGSGGEGAHISGNTYWDGTNWRYLNTRGALRYELDNAGSSHKWYNAPSGTAGNAITFTQAMTLTAAGNLGVGTSSPTTFGAGSILVTAAGTTTYGGFIGSTNNVTVQLWSDESAAFGIVGTRTNHPTVFTTNNSERARITSNGDFSITQSPGRYTVDTAGGATNIANGGTVDFSTASGMLVVNDWGNGGVTIYLCGGGNVTVVSSVIGQVGTLAYNAGINGYRWTNNTGVTKPFGFFFARTRSNA